MEMNIEMWICNEKYTGFARNEFAFWYLEEEILPGTLQELLRMIQVNGM